MIEVFISYSHKDDSYRNKLDSHLAILKRNGLISIWHDRRIAAGDEWKDQIDDALERAGIVLLLISPDFIASDYCYDIEMKRAIERHDSGDTVVIPIILRPTQWQDTPFSKLQALPKDSKPISKWRAHDSAYNDIVKSLRSLIKLHYNNNDNSPDDAPGKRIANKSSVHSDTVAIKVRKGQSVDLRTLIQKQDWIVGAVNFDEDIHFSSFYLRASCKKYMPPEYSDFSYTSIIAVNCDFNETYYIPRHECVAVADALLSKIQNDPSWLQGVLDDIKERAGILDDVFPYDGDSTPFRGKDLDSLLEIYTKHNFAHRSLYEVARIPEALDRGVGTFEKYLKKYLSDHMGQEGGNRKALNTTFQAITFPEEASYAQIELEEFHSILQEIRSTGLQSAFSGTSKRAILKLDPKLRSQIDKHRDKWSFWGYHGYGSRALPAISYYLDRVTAEFTHSSKDDPRRYSEVLDRAEQRRLHLFDHYNIDSDHRLLYRLYSRVGIIKLFRRYHQLRNFYFLDQLLDEIARLIGVPEGLVRSLLPDELEAILRKDIPLRVDYNDRIDHLIYVIDGDSEVVFSGAPKCTLVNGLLTQSDKVQILPGEKCQGTPVSGGVARGKCKIIIRREDAARVNFRPNDILVSESTDPDLLKLIRESSGVITESGGVACHAAIVCRELNKPALVGVQNALKILDNDDLIVLNADEGYLTTRRSIQREFTIDDTAVTEFDPCYCGHKAMMLARLLRASVVVPRFFVIPWEKLHKHYLQHASDAEGPAILKLTEEVNAALEYLSGEMFVIRSSMATEDTDTTAGAGAWITDTNVVREDVVSSLIHYIDRLKGEKAKDLVGSIVIQEMILGDASGICFTMDPMDQRKKRAMFEVVPGGNECLTDGQISPTRYFVSRGTKEIALDKQSKQWGSLLDPSALRRLVDTFRTVEAICGKPQDIEWTVKQGAIYILQSRPITASGCFDGQVHHAVTRRLADKGRNITSIYQAYRVPPNLRLHLLRVAALGNIICDKWPDDSLDRQTLVTALLLHDIGNIVKADYDRFPDLFPEEMRNLIFWKEVQRWIKQKYGESDVDASLAISKEIGVNTKVLELMARKLFIRNAETVISDSWELKIAAYADQRVGPYGLLRLEERLTEAKRRYKGVKYASVNHPNYEGLVRHAFEIENQICDMTQAGLEVARDDILLSSIERLRSFSLPIEAMSG